MINWDYCTFVSASIGIGGVGLGIIIGWILKSNRKI